MGTSCSDVCELVQEMLNGLGFKFDDNEASHDDMLQALYQCALVKIVDPVPQRYLVFVRGDIEPEIKGPFKDEDERDTEARRLKETDEGDESGIYPLDILGTTPAISAYNYAFFAPAEVLDEALDHFHQAQSQERGESG
jgi:hypothetical protein